MTSSDTTKAPASHFSLSSWLPGLFDTLNSNAKRQLSMIGCWYVSSVYPNALTTLVKLISYTATSHLLSNDLDSCHSGYDTGAPVFGSTSLSA